MRVTLIFHLTVCVTHINMRVMHSNTLHNTGRNRSRKTVRTNDLAARRICKNRVRIMLIRHGLSYAEVARRLGVTNRSTIARVVYGHYVLPEIREGIAGLLGVTADRLWPTDRAA